MVASYTPMKKLIPILLLLFGYGVSGQNTNTRRILPVAVEGNKLSISWDETESPINGFSRVLKNNKFSFINNKGIAISPVIFDGARNFTNHLAAVAINEKWGFINENGVQVIPCAYDMVFDFTGSNTIAYQNKKWLLINKSGVTLKIIDADVCYGIKNGIIAIEKNNRKAHLETDGRLVYDETISTNVNLQQRTNTTIINNANTNCPNNLNFEFGNFTNWRCYTGSVDSVGNTNVITVAQVAGPVANRHRIITRAFPSAVDFFGLFPTNPPDGSNFAVRLGNTNIGAQAERISYTIRVPQNDSNFSIKYNYAVVFQDPGHTTWSQPRFTARLFDSAANAYVNCASFEYISTSNLPGFARSTVDTSVIYKPWSSVFISLRAYAGKTMYLEFTTADCVRRGHWGYAYVDVENTCGQSIGVQYDCNYPNTTTLDAPPGFQNYNWWNQNYTTILATGQHAVLNPGPAVNTTLWLEMIPFNTFGCRDTLPVNISGGFTPSFTSSETNTSCAPHTFNFYNNNLPSVSATWNFGDGTTATGDSVSHTYNTPGTFIVTMSVSLPSGCSGSVSDTIVITQPTAAINYTGGSFCNNQNVQFNVSASGATSYTWDFGDGIILTTTNPTINHNYVNAGSYLPVLTVNYTGGCQIRLIGPDSIHIENIVVDFSYNISRDCLSSSVNFVANSQSQFGITGYAWNFGDGTTGNGETISHVYTRSGTYTVKLIVTGATGCKDSIVYPVRIFILIPPVTRIIAPASVCQGNPVTFFSNVNTQDSIVSINWFTDNGNTATGDSATFSFNQNGTYNVTMITTSIYGCMDTAVKQIIVKPLPVLNLPADQSLCNGVRSIAVIFNSSVNGSVYSWTNNDPSIGLASSGNGNLPSFIAINTSNISVYANITVTVTAQGCSLEAPAFTYVVHPTPEAIQPSNQEVCNRGTTDPVIFSSFTSAIASSTYTWTNNLPSIGLSSSGAGNIMPFMAINNTSTPVTASISITPTANGCIGLPANFTITVNPTPDVVPPTNQAVCNGTLSQEIIFTGLSGADSYTWTNNQPLIGLASSGTGDIRPFTAFNTTNAPVTASISVYPTLHGCSGNIQYFNITVNPTPGVNSIPNQNVCNGTAISSVNFDGSVAGAIYNWSNSDASIGLTSTGSGDILSFNPINNGYTPVTANIIVTPSIGGCNGLPQNFSITVNPLPDVIQPFNQFVCNGQQTPLINFIGMVPGTNFTWVNNNTSIGLAGTGNTDIQPFIAVNNTNSSISATITVTASAYGCPGNSKSFEISIDPTPDMAQPTNVVACNGEIINTVNFVGTVAGTTFSWINTSSEIGIPANGTGNIPSFIATNSQSYPITATITVLGLANSCNSVEKTFTITVNPSVSIDSIPDQMVCNGKSTDAIIITAPVIGTDITWTNDNPTIGLPSTGRGDIPSFIAVNNTNQMSLAVINVYGASPDNCQTAIKTFKIIVNPTPQIAAGNDVSVCRGSQANLTVNGAVQYQWTPATGLNCSNCSNPVTNVVNDITYVVEGTNNAGCKSYDTVLVAVIQPFNMLVSPNDSMCIGKSVKLKAMNADTYIWSPSTGLNNPNIAEPTATPTSSIRYQVIGYDSHQCFSDTGYVNITVGQSPNVNAGADIEAAAGSTVVLHAAAQNGPIISILWSPATNLSCDDCSTPTLVVGGNASYVVTVENKFGCKASDTVNIVSFCKNAQVFIPNAFTPDGDGANDILMVRGTGITVKSLRIFNRWGNLVFEKQSFPANEPKYGWDGKVKGILATPDVFVYIAEILCDNGTPYFYKGNVSLLQ